MNNQTSIDTEKITAQRQPGKFNDLQKITRLAINSFSKEKYELAVDYCRKAVDIVPATGRPELAAEIYYLWCLSCLKMEKYSDAKKICYEARLKLGNYLDLVYFEIIIASVNSEFERIPKLVDNYLEIYHSAKNNFDPLKEKTNEKFGEILLLCGQALEQSENIPAALNLYGKYLEFYPDDEPVKRHIQVLSNNKFGSNGN